MNVPIALIVLAALTAAALYRWQRRGLQSASIDLSQMDVETSGGEKVRLGSLIERPTILVLPRYYG